MARQSATCGNCGARFPVDEATTLHPYYVPPGVLNAIVCRDCNNVAVRAIEEARAMCRPLVEAFVRGKLAELIPAPTRPREGETDV